MIYDIEKCIRHPHADKQKETLCGKPIWSFDWTFTSVDHAVANGMAKGRLLPCPACRDIAVSALEAGA